MNGVRERASQSELSEREAQKGESESETRERELRELASNPLTCVMCVHSAAAHLTLKGEGDISFTLSLVERPSMGEYPRGAHRGRGGVTRQLRERHDA